MRLHLVAFSALGLALVGCGGLGQDQCANDNVECRTVYALDPIKAALQPGGNVTLTASVGRESDAIAFAVVGGDANGTLAYPTGDPGSAPTSARSATYAAPATTGTYKVTATYTKGSRVVSTQTATVSVAIPPQS